MAFNVYMGPIIPDGLPGMMYDQQREDYRARRDVALQEAELRMQAMRQPKYINAGGQVLRVGTDGNETWLDAPTREMTDSFVPLSAGGAIGVTNRRTGETDWSLPPVDRQNKTERFADKDGNLWERDPYTGTVNPVTFNGAQLQAGAGRTAGTGGGGGGGLGEIKDDADTLKLMEDLARWGDPYTTVAGKQYDDTPERKALKAQMAEQVAQMRAKVAGRPYQFGMPQDGRDALLPDIGPVNWNQGLPPSGALALNSPQVSLMLALTGTGAGTAPGQGTGDRGQKVYASEMEVAAAAARGEIKPGDVVTVNGRQAVWE